MQLEPQPNEGETPSLPPNNERMIHRHACAFLVSTSIYELPDQKSHYGFLRKTLSGQCYLFSLQQNEANQDDVDGVPNTGVMKDPSHLSSQRSVTTKSTTKHLWKKK